MKRGTNDPSDDTTMKRSSGVTSTDHRSRRGAVVVSAWERDRAPFLLYLRSFRLTMHHGPDQRMLLENHLWATLSLPPAIGVLTIVDPEDVPLPGAYGHGAPALALPNECWQEVVSGLIEKAELIISEVPVLSPGAQFELEICVKKGKIGQTIVIIPSPDGPFPFLDDNETIERFPRVIWYDELPPVGAKDHFVFRDLITRARLIAQLRPAERLALADSGRVLEQFPVSFEGLREGYEQAATHYKRHGALARAVRSNYRALIVATMKIALASEGLIVGSDDEAARISIVERIAHLNLAMDDRPAAVSHLKGAMKLAADAGDEHRLQDLQRQLQELETTSVQM